MSDTTSPQPTGHESGRRGRDRPTKDPSIDALLDRQSERRLLGYALANHPCDHLESLANEAMTDEVHQLIFAALRELSRRKGPAREPGPPGRMELSELLDWTQIGGSDGLNDLLDAARDIDAATAHRLATHLAGLHHRRTLHEIASNLAANALTTDVDIDALRGAASRLLEASIGGSDRTRSARTVRQALVDELARPLPIARTGYGHLNEILGGGFVRGMTYGFVAEPKAGLTMLMAGCAERMAASGHNVLYVSLKTTPEDIDRRALAAAMGTNALALWLRGRQEHYDRAQAAANASPENLRWLHAPDGTAGFILNQIRVAKLRHNIRIAFVDFWQIVRGRGKGDTEEQHLRRFAHDCALLAQELAITIVTGALTGRRDQRVYQSEGLDAATAMVIMLHREPAAQNAWFSVRSSSYTRLATAGTPDVPAIILDVDRGPRFIEAREAQEAAPDDLSRPER